MMEAGWYARRVSFQLVHSGRVVRMFWDHSGSERCHVHEDQAQDALDRQVSRLLRVLPLTPTHRRIRLVWRRARGNWTVAEWNQVVFSYEFRFNLSSDDNRVRVRSPRGECLNPAFALQ
ncbi:transposable element Tcb1 transposase [Trichonephila clavipes]|nr:transposable element Tcb1 transposase [Trichonephila clavipes]